MQDASSDVPRTGFGIVPVASMRLIGYNSTGRLFDVVRPIGVTSLWFAAIAAVMSLVITISVLHATVGVLHGIAGNSKVSCPEPATSVSAPWLATSP